MRAKIFLSVCALLLVGTALLLLKMGPEPVADRELPVPVAPDSAVVDVHGPDAGKDAEAAGQEEADPVVVSAPDSKQVIGAIDSTERISPAQKEAYRKAPPLSAQEVKSVHTALGTFFSYSRGRQGLNNLIKELEAAGLAPVLAKDFHPDTGKMLIIRTEEAMPGTRYYHAQVFEDDDRNKEPFRQHMSFEIRPSPDCMKVARDFIEKKLGKKLGKPVRERSDEWVEWEKGADSIWIKRLSAEELSHDRFNARTKADVGTCRAAVELRPEHGEEEGSGHKH